jgi:hypothetical protein
VLLLFSPVGDKKNTYCLERIKVVFPPSEKKKKKPRSNDYRYIST